jgi:hypothetical protein
VENRPFAKAALSGQVIESRCSHEFQNPLNTSNCQVFNPMGKGKNQTGKSCFLLGHVESRFSLTGLPALNQLTHLEGLTES